MDEIRYLVTYRTEGGGHRTVLNSTMKEVERALGFKALKETVHFMIEMPKPK